MTALVGWIVILLEVMRLLRAVFRLTMTATRYVGHLMIAVVEAAIGYRSAF